MATKPPTSKDMIDEDMISSSAVPEREVRVGSLTAIQPGWLALRLPSSWRLNPPVWAPPPTWDASARASGWVRPNLPRNGATRQGKEFPGPLSNVVNGHRSHLRYLNSPSLNGSKYTSVKYSMVN